MIQLNLLPDVKLEFIKAQRLKRLVMSISTIIIIASVGIFVLLFSYVNGVQKKNISDLTGDIKVGAQDLTDTKDLNRILTVQNQMKQLDSLHADKPESSRLFSFIQAITPSDVTISKLEADFEAGTLTITGNAPRLASVNTYADALKFTKFKIDKDSDSQPAFNGVALSSFAISEGDQPQYSFTMNFDSELFAQGEDIKVEVPKIISSRSSTEKPGAVFQGGGQ